MPLGKQQAPPNHSIAPAANVVVGQLNNMVLEKNKRPPILTKGDNNQATATILKKKKQ